MAHNTRSGHTPSFAKPAFNMTDVTPRVSSGLLDKYKGRAVRLVGRVLRVSPDFAIVEASDKGQVKIIFQQSGEFPDKDQYVETMGRVTSELAIEATVTINFGSKFDMDIHNQVVELAQKFPALFGS